MTLYSIDDQFYTMIFVRYQNALIPYPDVRKKMLLIQNHPEG